MNLSSGSAVAAMIGTIVLSATAGDVLIASAMRSVSDGAIFRATRFVGGASCMAISFFSLLFSLSHADVSLIAPAAGSLTFVSNAIAARWLLHENVDRRRWVAAILVCCGVALLKS